MISRPFLTLLAACCCALPACTQQNAPGPPPNAEAIMARVAANQDRTEAARSHYIYVQHARVQSRKGSTVLCEEVTDYRITPSAKGQTQALLKLEGHVRNGKSVVRYTELPKAHGSDDGVNVNVGDHEIVHDADHAGATVLVSETDIDLVENMRRNFTSDDKSKDGVNAGLFPLTSKQQHDMVFELKGREPKNGRDTFHITFRPKEKDDYGWKGDAWIDTTEYQPVVVRTALSRSLPFAVRALLGVNVPGLGFTVIYAPQGDDKVWFPAGFGTEFKIKVLFFFNRQMVVTVEDRDFERTHVTTTIHGDEAQPVEEPKSTDTKSVPAPKTHSDNNP